MYDSSDYSYASPVGDLTYPASDKMYWRALHTYDVIWTRRVLGFISHY